MNGEVVSNPAHLTVQLHITLTQNPRVHNNTVTGTDQKPTLVPSDTVRATVRLIADQKPTPVLATDRPTS